MEQPPTIEYATPVETGPKSDPLATASIICGLLAMTSCLSAAGFGEAGLLVSLALAVVAVVAGLVAVVRTTTFAGLQVKRRTPKHVGAVQARWGLMLGLGPLVILLMLPTMGRAREPANCIKCASNLRQIGQALRQYDLDHPGAAILPVDDLVAWSDLASEVFVCPSSNTQDAPGPLILGRNRDYHYLRRASR